MILRRTQSEIICTAIAVLWSLATLAGVSSPAWGVTLTWTGLGDGTSFADTANWSGTPTSGAINVANLVDSYVVDAPAAVINSPSTLAFVSGGGLQMTAGTLSVLSGNGIGVLETVNTYGSLALSGSVVTAQYLAEMNVSLGASATLNLLGSGNPVNITTIDFTDESAQLHFLAESPTNVLDEHIGKISVLGGVAVEGVNLNVVSDGSGGTIVTPIPVEVIEPTLTLQVDRDTGSITLTNQTGAPIDFFEYDIFSPAGGLNAGNWTSIAGNYDGSAFGDGSVDADDTWLRFSEPGSRTDLAEGTLGTTTLPHNGAIDFGDAWIPSPFEDLTATLSLVDGSDLAIEVVYSGSLVDAPIEIGDMNADGTISATDWPLLRDNLFGDVSGLHLVDAHAAGDLDLSGRIDEHDLLLFEALYDEQQGTGSFAAMVAQVPEPSTWAVSIAVILSLVVRNRSLWLSL